MAEEIKFEKYKKRGAYHWKDYFGNIFQIDSFLRGRYDTVINFLSQSGAAVSSSILEIGCGDGALSGLIYKKFHCKITGLEPRPEGVEFSRQMFERHGFKGTFEISKGYSFQYPDNCFDFVVLADVIEHLQEPQRMLKEINRVLKPGGKAIVTTPIRVSEYPEDAMHVCEFYPDELKEMCRPYFGDPVEAVYSHPIVLHELYTYGRKFNRSVIRLYCRIHDKLFNNNLFLKKNPKRKWKNFKQQGLLLEKHL